MKKIEVFIMSIVVFLTIVAWVAMDLYHIQQKINDQIDIKPAEIPNYQMDQQVIEMLKQKKE